MNIDPLAQVKAGFDWKLILKIFVVFVIINGVIDMIVAFGGQSGIEFAQFFKVPFSYVKARFFSGAGSGN